VLTLAERFRLRGYQTLGIISNNHVLSIFNFDQGFEIYDSPSLDSPTEPVLDPGMAIQNIAAAEVHALALRHLAEARDPRRPLFLYIHTVDPHNPYHPPDWLVDQERPTINANEYLLRMINEGEGASPQILRDLALSYQGAVAYADHELGKFLGELASHLDPARMVLAVTSDHGEGFFEHHLVGHRQWLYEEMIRIPLILRGPGVPAGRRDLSNASLMDVGPTLLALADPDAQAVAFAQGVNLLGNGRSSPQESRAVQGEFSSGAVLVRGEWKLAYHADYPEPFRFALFNLREDPRERINRIEQQVDLARRLQSEFRSLHTSARLLAVDPLPVNVSRLDPALLQNLRALGYLK
jgi:arylsulfatase A-like enzyme